MRLSNLIKKLIKKIVIEIKFFRRPAIAYTANNVLLPAVIIETPPAKLRESLFLPPSQHETQLNQDIFALLINRFKSGFFVEIGANDGITLSNTVYLEQNFGWNGILVEANPKYHDDLQNRKSESVIAAIVDEEGYYEFCTAGLYGGITALLDKKHENLTRNADSISVWGTRLDRILSRYGAPSNINFISVDTEGAEVSIVEQMCSLESYRFMCGCIEYNGRQDDYQSIKRLLCDSGYRVVWEGQTRHDLFFIDEKMVTGSAI